MALTVTVGSASADSYATVVEADAYLAVSGYDISSWSVLTSTEKEKRLILACAIMQTMAYRGRKACENQRLSFPRWSSRDERENVGKIRFNTLEDITAYGYTAPSVPESVKNAQVEIAFQVVHSYLLTLEIMEGPESQILGFGLGGAINIEFASAKIRSRNKYFDRARLDSTAIVELYLVDWRKTFVGAWV